MRKIKNLFRCLRNERGSFSLEAIIAMSAVLMVTSLGIAYFTYLAPRQILTQEVHVLTQTAKIQGGLTTNQTDPGNGDVERFKERLAAKGFDADKITVEAYAEKDGEVRDVIGVEPLSEGYLSVSKYSHRNSKEIITIRVTIPAKLQFLNAIKGYFGSKNTHGNYVFTETIMSERW